MINPNNNINNNYYNYNYYYCNNNNNNNFCHLPSRRDIPLPLPQPLPQPRHRLLCVLPSADGDGSARPCRRLRRRRRSSSCRSGVFFPPGRPRPGLGEVGLQARSLGAGGREGLPQLFDAYRGGEVLTRGLLVRRVVRSNRRGGKRDFAWFFQLGERALRLWLFDASAEMRQRVAAAGGTCYWRAKHPSKTRSTVCRKQEATQQHTAKVPKR